MRALSVAYVGLLGLTALSSCGGGQTLQPTTNRVGASAPLVQEPESDVEEDEEEVDHAPVARGLTRTEHSLVHAAIDHCPLEDQETGMHTIVFSITHDGVPQNIDFSGVDSPVAACVVEGVRSADFSDLPGLPASVRFSLMFGPPMALENIVP